jgi:hypothetical protein
LKIDKQRYSSFFPSLSPLSKSFQKVRLIHSNQIGNQTD